MFVRVILYRGFTYVADAFLVAISSTGSLLCETCRVSWSFKWLPYSCDILYQVFHHGNL